MGNCFSCEEKTSDRLTEDVESKPYEQPNQCASFERTDLLLDRCMDEDEGHGDHEKISSSVSDDRISDLPDDVLLLILSFLPMKSIVQTSVLSRRWIHVWSSYPILDFYEIFTGNEASHHDTRVRIINTILARRDENYSTKQVKHRSLMTSFPSGRLFQRVKTHSRLASVKNLVLDIALSTSDDQKTSCQLECHSISLRSSRCGTSSKPSWLGFPTSYVVVAYIQSLHTLSLRRMDFLHTCALGVDLFSGSSFPSLEKLVLERCRGMSDLKISCPNLKDVNIWNMYKLQSMDVSGMRLESLLVSNCFKEEERIDGRHVNIFAPNLQNFEWSFNGIIDRCLIRSFPMLKTSRMDYFIPWGTTTPNLYKNCVADLLSCSSQVEELDINHDFFQILSQIYSEGGLPFSFMKLKTLEIFVAWRQESIPGIACLFKSSPIVHTLVIALNDSGDLSNVWLEQYWELQAQYLIPFFSHLKYVTISGYNKEYMILENVVIFAKFLLKYGRVLQKMTLSFPKRNNNVLPDSRLDDTIALLKTSPRASAEVDVEGEFFVY